MSKKKNSTDTLAQNTLLWDLQTDTSSEPTLIETALHNTVGAQPMESPTLVNIDHTVSMPLADLLKENEVLANRYRVLGILGKGGMGEVLRVFDEKFQRTLAMKIIHSSLIHSPLIEQLFIKEAKSTGLLQHPGTIPVHDFGTLTDGRLYFTMQEVQGITLKEAIQAVHQNGAPSDWTVVTNDWSIKRLLDAFERICETMAYAHDLGIMHRDIKPANFMLGDHGEVLVMDWGIAKILPHGETVFPDSNAIRPNVGSIVGTPEYISPEQAAGESDSVAAHSDVFSLGCVLYEIITGKTIRPKQTMDFNAINHTSCPTLPVSDTILQDIYAQCVALNPTERYPDAGTLHTNLSKWLDGESKRQNALLLVQKANEHNRHVIQSHRRIIQITSQIEKCKSTIQKWSPLEEKKHLWDLEDERDKLQQDADYAEMNCIEWLHSALNYAPDLSIAHQTLARIYHSQRQRAIINQNHRQAVLMLELMRYHDRGEFEAYLSGVGSLTFDTFLLSDWTLLKFESRHRRLESIEVGPIKQRTTTLPIGSYILRSIHNEKHQIPFCVTRNQPHVQIPDPIIPELNNNDCWIPAGPTTIGDSQEPENPRRTVFIPGFVMQEHPITNRQYLDFLHSLYEEQGFEKANVHVPRANALSESEAMRLYTWEPEIERFVIKPDPTGDIWDLDWPVIMITGTDAMAYAEWYSQNTGQSWRLPTAEEWEKAARGVDERKLPWGDYFEPTWACIRGHKEGRSLPAVIGAHPLDRSVYGIYGLAGNVQDFCIDHADPTHIITKGGSWSYHSEFIHMAIIRRFKMDYKFEVCGFRLVRSL